MSFIRNLQNKTERQKRIILFLSVGVLMILVFFVWVFQFKNSLEFKTENQNEELTSVSELAERVTETYKSSTERIQEINEILGEIE